MATKEAQLLTAYFEQLVNAIVSPGPVANSLYAEGMIGKETRDAAMNLYAEKITRASNLVSAASVVAGSSPDHFNKFLNVMKRQEPAVKIVVEKIENEYRKLLRVTAVYFEFELTALLRVHRWTGEAR